MAIINLYPPIVDTAMPGFISENGVNVYFSISNYNSIENIANAQVTVVNQYNNLTALDKSKYPSEIMLKEVLTDATRADDKYYVHIEAADLQNANFAINTYYKVQIRFTSNEAEEISLNIPQALDSWLTNNLDQFSEWSTVCLIRAIAQPTLSVAGFDIIDGHIAWSMANNKITGTLTFADNTETDLLNNYRIKLYDNNNTLLTDSGLLFSDNYNNPNTFIYNLKYGFKLGQAYYFTIDYQTNTLYQDSIQLNFDVVQDSADDKYFNLTTETDDENGRIKLVISRNMNNASYTGSVVIRRASSEDNFTIWEDLFKKDYVDITGVKDIWYDQTIKGGVWYKYALQVIDTNKNRGYIKIIQKGLISLFEDIFLTTKNKQLKIKFNPTVSSFKQTISETKIDTIGSRYPFIRRNGAINYAQFPITGLVSFQMDEDQTFISEDELYQYKEITNQYNKFYEDEEKNNIYPILDNNNYIKEKKFRDAVMDFLNDGEVKLFRSPTEGNYLIRLMDVNFQPNQTLGRMIWSFSANAIEIDEDTVDNYEKYNIIDKRG